MPTSVPTCAAQAAQRAFACASNSQRGARLEKEALVRQHAVAHEGRRRHQAGQEAHLVG
jgi:hypothetical protein